MAVWARQRPHRAQAHEGTLLCRGSYPVGRFGSTCRQNSTGSRQSTTRWIGAARSSGVRGSRKKERAYPPWAAELVSPDTGPTTGTRSDVQRTARKKRLPLSSRRENPIFRTKTGAQVVGISTYRATRDTFALGYHEFSRLRYRQGPDDEIGQHARRPRQGRPLCGAGGIGVSDCSRRAGRPEQAGRRAAAGFPLFAAGPHRSHPANAQADLCPGRALHLASRSLGTRRVG